MSKEELLECLKSLSTTNNKRDGIDIKKEEAQLIIEIINNYKKILDKIKELINHYAVEDEDYSKIYNQEEKDILELLEEIE